MYPTLEKSHKGTFPFRLGTTSFIYPDNYETNVRLLAPYLDEIELLFLEGDPESLPKKKETAKLARLKEEYNITYNIHLPYDLDLGHPETTARCRAVDTVKMIVSTAEILEPSTYTLHFHRGGTGPGNSISENRRKRLRDSIRRILETGVTANRFSVETLSYPFYQIEDIVYDCGLGICLDIGHLFLFGFDPHAEFEKYAEKTGIIHLHGVRNQQDHLGLDKMPMDRMKTVIDILKRYTGVVSLEVFSYKHLKSSLRHLTCFFEKQGIEDAPQSRFTEIAGKVREDI